MNSRPYSLRHAHQVLKGANTYYRRHRKKLSPSVLSELENLLAQLDKAILDKDRVQADSLARQLKTFEKEHFKRSFPIYFFEVLLAILFALVVATVVRQMWFELYKIPTGSMRPAFRELDHLTVTKTAFGINTPLSTSHLYFDPSLMRRAGVVVFSADGLKMSDTESTYFWIFPAKKRLIKRCLGLPGDTLYFYGGKLYGIDAQERNITDELNPPLLEKLDHVPFITFEGQLSIATSREAGRVQSIYLEQMGQQVGRLNLSGSKLEGSIFNGRDWVKDNPAAAMQPHQSITTYSDFMGMGNFAGARLLTHAQLSQNQALFDTRLEKADLYLELQHHPTLTEPQIIKTPQGAMQLYIHTETSFIPLKEAHLKALKEALYTVRFVVKKGRAAAYNIDGTVFNHFSPEFSDVPDGTYEFFYGKAYEVKWGGITCELPQTHPLNQNSPAHLQKLFNLGISMSTAFSPDNQELNAIPTRFAYFRNGALYVMGGAVLQAEDPTLQAFHEAELKKGKSASSGRPYLPFIDQGPPLKEGKIDVDFLKAFGVKIPEKHYLMLGDNYARSGDSRAFGPVPEANIQGAPSWILWPPGARWGAPLQPPYPLFNVPRTIVWGAVLLLMAVWYLFTRWQMGRPLFKKL